MKDLFKIKEHRSFKGQDSEIIQNLGLDFSCKKGDVKYLGLNPNMQVSYFIGVGWLVEKEYAIQVDPKIEGLDAMKMFIESLKSPILNNELKNIYHIDFNKPQIEIETNQFDITPMLLLHFINVIKHLATRGLKKDYTRKEENLQSKLKGKIKFSNHFKHNISKGRFDNNYCNYQEYSVDNIENQLLKRTLLFTKAYLAKYYNTKEIFSSINYCLSAFENVSDNVNLLMINKIHINPIFKEYAEALSLAKMILKRFAYSISETTKESVYKTYPYWIDMSLLFEIYVYGKLRDAYGSTIKYQEKGKYGNTDFLKTDERIVIDTKYKMIYNIKRYDIDNIRQISGYARDINIRKKLNTEKDELLNCCIIYPNHDKQTGFINRTLTGEEKIEQFEKFWKIGIRLPLID
jgi:5-methylcytosine-specific restriction enzyme subunit McrC